MPPHSPPARPTTVTQREWDLLQALWSSGPVTARQLADRLHAEHALAYSTVKTMLDRMAAKGHVRARQVGHVWEYAAAIEPDQARRSAWRRFLDGAFGGAIDPALRFIAKDAKLTRKQRDALRTLLGDEESAS